MKTLLPILMLTITASMFGQDTNVHDKMLQTISRSLGMTYILPDDSGKQPGAVYKPAGKLPKQKPTAWIESDVTPPGIIIDKAVHTFVIHIPLNKRDDAQAIVYGTRDKIVAALNAFDEKYNLTVYAELHGQNIIYSDAPATYYASPLHIMTWCSDNFCSSTIYGGNVYPTYGTTKVLTVKMKASAAAQNY